MIEICVSIFCSKCSQKSVSHDQIFQSICILGTTNDHLGAQHFPKCAFLFPPNVPKWLWGFSYEQNVDIWGSIIWILGPKCANKMFCSKWPQKSKVIWESPMTKLLKNVHILGVQNAHFVDQKCKNLQNYFFAPNAPKIIWVSPMTKICTIYIFGGSKMLIWGVKNYSITCL